MILSGAVTFSPISHLQLNYTLASSFLPVPDYVISQVSVRVAVEEMIRPIHLDTHTAPFGVLKLDVNTQGAVDRERLGADTLEPHGLESRQDLQLRRYSWAETPWREEGGAGRGAVTRGGEGQK